MGNGVKPATRAGTLILKELNRCRSTGVRPWEIFNDFLQSVDATLDMLPAHLTAAAETGRLADDPPETEALWDRLAMRYKLGHHNYLTHFQKAWSILLAQTDLYSGNPDHLGAVFEAQEFGNQANGQFLTPWHVCELMAKMSPGDNSVTILRSIVSHADQRPSLGESVLDQMIDGLALSRVLREIEKPGFGRFVDDYLIPALENGWQPFIYNDPCIGSGRTLLAAATQYPGWMHYFGLVRFTGQDIDQTMCLISRINFRLCGLNGWGLRFNAGLDERTRANIRRRLDRTSPPQYVVQNGRVVAVS